MTTTRPDLVNLPELTNPTDEQTKFVIQDSGVNQTLTAQRTRDFLGNQIGPTGPQGPTGVKGPQGPQGVQGPQGPAFVSYSSSTVTPQNYGTVILAVTTSNHSFQTGNRVRAINSITNYFEGDLELSGDRLGFTVYADYAVGFITSNTWVITLAGEVGATGPQGPQGVQGPTGPSLRVTSNTTATPANSGTIPLVVSTSNHAFITGQRVIASSGVNNFFEGVVTIIGGITFNIAADFNIGTTPASNWEISIAGQRGSTGPQGPQGVQGPTGPGLLVTSNSLATPDGISLTTLIVNTNQHVFVQGLRVLAINTNSNFFEGTITNNVVGSTTFIIQQDSYQGGTPATSWTVVVAGKEGPQGPQGPINPFATTSTNIAGGSSGTIPIQSAPGITAFIAAGTSGTILAWQGTTATWQTTASISVGTAGAALGVLAKDYTTAELSPLKSIAILDFAGVGTPSDIGHQASLDYNTNLERLEVNKLSLSSSEASTGTSSGALSVSGGVGITKNIIVAGDASVAGIFTVTNTTPSTSPTTGALQVRGGVGISNDLYVGGEIVAQKLTIELTTVTTNLVTTDDIIKTTNATAATNTQSGALQVTGGAGIGGDIHLGGQLYGTVTTATNLAQGAPGTLVYQINTGQTGYVAIGGTGTVLVSGYDQSPVWQNTLTLSSTESAVSTTSGALQVVGGVGVGGDLYVGGTIDGRVTNIAGGATGSLFYQISPGVTGFIPIGANNYILVSNGTTASWGPATGIVAGSANTATFLANGAQYQIPYQTAPGITAFEAGFEYDYTINTFKADNVSATNATFASTVTIYGNNSATSTQSGDLQVVGGVGIGGDLYVGGQVVAQKLVIEFTTVTTTLVTTDDIIKTTNATQSTGTDSGALQITGGAGIGGDLFVGGTLNVSGLIAGLATTATNIGGGSPGQVPFQTGTGTTSFFGPGTAGDVLVSGGTSGPRYQNTLTLASTAQAVSTETGALVVKGGVAIAGNLYVGGSAVGIITTGTNLAGGLPGSIPYQSATNATSFIPRGITGTVLVSRFNQEPVFQNTLTLAGTDSAISTQSGALQVVGGVGIGGDLHVGGTIYATVTTATNLANGATGSIPYQDNPGSTKFIPIGVNGYILVSNGTTASFQAPTGLSAGSANTSTNLKDGAQYQIPYQTAPGATAFEPGFEYRYDIDTFSVTNVTVFGTTTSISSTTGALQVAGGVGVQKDINVGGGGVIAGILTITNTTSATNTLTGALQVFGGASFQNDIHVWGSIFASTLVIDVTTVSTNFVVTDDVIQTNNTTNSVSTSTGALIIKGGAGFGRDVYVGGIIYGTATNAFTATTATNLLGGTVGQIPFQTAPSTTGFFGPGVTGTVLVSRGNSVTGPVFQNTLTLSGTENSTSTNSGALQVVGGVGIGGDLRVGGVIYGFASVSGVITSATNLIGGTAGQTPFQTAPGVTSYYGPGTGGDVLVSRSTLGPIYQNTLTLSGTTAATNTTTGALQVRGGAGIGGNVYVGGDLNVDGQDITSNNSIFNLLVNNVTQLGFAQAATTIIMGATSGFTNVRNLFTLTNTTNATSSFTGALRVVGGAGIGQDLVVGGIIKAAADMNSTSTTTGALQVTGGAAVNKDLIVKGTIKAIGNTNANNTTSGDLQVIGGVGIGGDLYVGGVIYGLGSVSGTITTATNLALGTAGQIPYQSAPSTTLFFGPGTGGDVLVSNGTAAPAYKNTLTLAGTTAATNTTTGALQVRGGAGIGGDVYLGQILNVAGNTTLQGDLAVNGGDITSSQTTFNLLNSGVTTLNLAGAGTAVTIGTTTGFTNIRNLFTLTNTTNATSTITGALRVAGGAGIGRDLYVGGLIYGTLAGGSSASSSTLVVSTSGSTVHFLTFVDSNNATATAENFYTTSSFSISPNNGNVSIAGITTVTNTTSATSTLTGALQVKGGMGIGGSMYLNGYLQVGFTNTTSYSTGTNGEIRATNEITAYFGSDINLKENIRLIESPVTLINQIRGVYFDWKDSYIETRGGEDGYFVRKADIGVIAQEVEKILPEIVATRPDGFKAVKYDKMVPLLIEAIKALSLEIEELKKKIG